MQEHNFYCPLNIVYNIIHSPIPSHQTTLCKLTVHHTLRCTTTLDTTESVVHRTTDNQNLLHHKRLIHNTDPSTHHTNHSSNTLRYITLHYIKVSLHHTMPLQCNLSHQTLPCCITRNHVVYRTNPFYKLQKTAYHGRKKKNEYIIPIQNTLKSSTPNLPIQCDNVTHPYTRACNRACAHHACAGLCLLSKFVLSTFMRYINSAQRQ